jgi:hypothetical protein
MNSLTTNSQEISQVSPTATPLDSLSSLWQGLVKQLLAMDKAGKEAVKPLLPKEIQELIENGTEIWKKNVAVLLEWDRKWKEYLFWKQEEKENIQSPEVKEIEYANALSDEDFSDLIEAIKQDPEEGQMRSYYELIKNQQLEIPFFQQEKKSFTFSRLNNLINDRYILTPTQLDSLITEMEKENKVFFYHLLLIRNPKKYKLNPDQVDRLITSMSDKNWYAPLNLMLIQYQNNLLLSDEIYTLTTNQVDLLITNMSDGNDCKSLIMMQKRLNYTLTPLQVDVLVTKILDSTISPAGYQELIMGQEDFGYTLTANQINKLDIKMKGLDKKKTMIRKGWEKNPLGNFWK